MTNDHGITEVMRQEAQDSATQEQDAESSNSFIKNAALFFASPFIAIAYMVALPFVGLYQFTKHSHDSRVRQVRRVKRRRSKRKK